MTVQDKLRVVAGVAGVVMLAPATLLAVVAPHAVAGNEATQAALRIFPWLALLLAALALSLLLYAWRPAIGELALKLLALVGAGLLLLLTFLPEPVFGNATLSVKLAVVAFAALLVLRFSGLLKRRPRDA